MKNIVSILLVSALLIGCSKSNYNPNSGSILGTWEKTLGGSNYFYGTSGQQTTDGGYIIGGYTRLPSIDESNFCLFKTDENGNELWRKTFETGSKDVCNSVQQTTDGGYILTGWELSFGNFVSKIVSISLFPKPDILIVYCFAIVLY